MSRTYRLTVHGPATFTTVHRQPTWAFKYAELYKANWPTARITLTSEVAR